MAARPVLNLILLACFGPVIVHTAGQQPRTTFRVKYVAAGVVYLDGGRSAGLAQNMKLTIRRQSATSSSDPAAADLAELQVLSVAETSAVCEVKSSSQPVRAGDTAYLSAEDIQMLEALRSAGAAKHYAQTITFTEGDPLDEEVREYMPHPPLPEVNRIRGRIGFEYNSILDAGGAGLHSSQSGLVFRADMTRIGGTYWNLSGYTRTLLNTRSTFQQNTLSDLVNRTYHLTLSYNSPKSNWTMGFGRFYLPWAASLSTIDGGYLGRRIGKNVTVGTFAGSTPDPTSWNYNPNRQMAGTFLNYEGGSFDGIRYSTTTGVAVSRIHWQPERQFAFFENAIFFKRYFSIYHNMEADKLTKAQIGTGFGSGVAATRSFLTLRYQPHSRIAFDLSHNYFRDLPTFDPSLIGLGLVDKLLFQGVTVGVRAELPYRLSFYTNLGRSSRTGDTKHSLNQMYGLTRSNLFGTGIRADVRYSRFDSSFGRGAYKALSFSRNVRETLRFEVQAGQQNFASMFTSQSRARYVNGNVDWLFGAHYFLGGGATAYRGQTQNYNQTYINMGYRF